MTSTGAEIICRSLWDRAIRPTLALLTLVVIAIALYNNFWRLGLPSLQRIAGHLFGLTVFFSVGCGALFVYRAAFFRRARPTERICACLVTPLLYTASEVLRVREFFSWGSLSITVSRRAFNLSCWQTSAAWGWRRCSAA